VTEGIIELTVDNFDAEVLLSPGPVLVDFWASWCGPCKTIAPVVEEIASEYRDRLKVCKLNVDDHGQIAGKYNVEGIPTLILFKEGKAEEKIVGALSKEDIIAKIEPKL